MTKRGDNDRPMTAQQVADLFSVHRATVGQWAKDGVLPFFSTPGGQRRFQRDEVEALYARMQGPAAA